MKSEQEQTPSPLKTTDIRNANFHALRDDEINDRQRSVLNYLAAVGPATTRQLSEAMHWDVLSVRPRVTELLSLGLVRLAGRAGKEGVYAVVAFEEWQTWRRELLGETVSCQQQLL